MSEISTEEGLAGLVDKYRTEGEEDALERKKLR
jgi:hypothetical protein